ncbi:MAG TPA: nucleotidyltransferase family protein [Vicinamibacterales bacterium]|nr:nucleotidyltransferase family protein [Vicinamibacterales bacterium]
MTPEERTFRLLALCTQRPGHPAVSGRLRSALAALPPGSGLVEGAERHGLVPLLFAHVRSAGAVVTPSVVARLFGRHMQQAHAAAVRTRLVRDAVQALAQADVPLLVLKGAALARLVYADPALRPMRDVDLLVRPRDARRAYEVLQCLGFAPIGTAVAPGHHHLEGLAKTEDGATIAIELHHELLARTPFVASMAFDDLLPASQTFEWAGLTLRTLGREDMLWHVYAHAFVVNTLCPGARLISVADLVHATEEWVDVLDWDLLRERYARMVRALPLVQELTPWSARVNETLRIRSRRPVSGVHAVSSSVHWSAALSRDVLWPPEWWFRMRYGIDGWRRWSWYRFAGHPLRVAAAAADAAARRIARGVRPGRPHALLGELALKRGTEGSNRAGRGE